MQLTTTNRQGFAPATFTEARQFAEELASSSLVPKQYVNKPLDVLVAMQWGAELGLAPMQALQNIAVINGKPSVYGDAMMALVQASPVCEDIKEYMEGEGTPNPVAVCVATRRNRTPVVAKFSVEDAKRAGLWGKQGPWQAYPKRMMKMRARGFALRDAFPDVLKGLISAEEAEDYPEEAKPRERDVTPTRPANPLDAIAPPEPPAIELEPIVEGVKAIMEERPIEELISIGKEFVDALMATEPVDVEPQNDPAESAEPAAESVVVDQYPLLVPNLKAERAEGAPMPVLLNSVWPDLETWSNAYEEMADKTARAGKRPARERMTILKELRNVNDGVIEQIDAVSRLRHTAAYSKRLKALGATIEKNPDE